ncbi:MAG: FtsW/RodA/SpoVE family cell cycle protein [bacterium]|nr:FtsW/RodA/SpoVE family cell cycle protein [bacterium]
MKLLIPMGVVLAAGLLVLLSSAPHLFWYQLLWIAFATLVFFAVQRFDWRSFINYRWVVGGIYALGILLLVLTLFLAPSIRGVKSWLPLGPFQFQPAEFMKAALILLYAQFFARGHMRIAHARTLFASFAFAALPAALIALQPDFGSAVIFFLIWFGFVLVSGIRLRHLALTAMCCAILGVLLWGVWLEDYQKARIAGLFIPERDPLGVNYNVIQSKIAIGSAGFFGKGFGQGTQVQLGFLPEVPTDFPFPAVIEEWGLVGGAAALSAFFYLLFAILGVGMGALKNFEKFICLGAVILFAAHFALNVGSAVGLLPVVGVPFPFLSYGGSNLLTSAFLVAIIHSIAART